MVLVRHAAVMVLTVHCVPLTACSRTGLDEGLADLGSPLDAGPNSESGEGCTPSCTGKTCGSSNECGGTCAGACADSGATMVVLFGGNPENDFNGDFLGDTWTWDDGAWTKKEV